MITLKDAAKLARVRTLTYTKDGGKGREPQVHHIAWEGFDTTVVHSRDRDALASMLLNYSVHRMIPASESLLSYAGRRGFNIKHKPPEEKKNNGSSDTTADSD